MATLNLKLRISFFSALFVRHSPLFELLPNGDKRLRACCESIVDPRRDLCVNCTFDQSISFQFL